VRRSSVGSSSACSRAGPSSILGSEVFPIELTGDLERNFSEWGQMMLNVLYECDKINVLYAP
jgi:hypothetical protein